MSIVVPPLSSHPDLSARTYEVLRREIVTCDLPPGARLEVVDLARRLGVSRTPVTDALNKLSGEGLVTEIPRKGYFVADVNIQDYLDVLEARLTVELGLAERAIELATAEQIDLMRSLIERQQEYLDEQGDYADYPGWVETDCEFHRATVSVARNRHITAFHSRLNTHMFMARIYFSTKVGHRPSSASVKEHSAIVDAFLARNVHALKAAFTYHIQETANFFASAEFADRLRRLG